MDTKGIFKKSVNTLTLASFLLWNLAGAAPEGGSVTQGSATISQSGAQTTINQASQNAVINWNSFNTASQEAVQFNQPNSSSVALNRITNGLPTQFAGSLNANGQVWILNPAGVLFTNTARVDVAGLVATTHGILDANFMSGNYQFDLVPGFENASIINNGLISAKDSGIVALVAPHVANNGLIQANLGKVSLASGPAYTLDMYGDSLINFGSHAPINNGSVSNAGKIIADGGKVYMTANYAAGVLDNMISMSGTIQAKSVGVNSKGEIVLYGADYQTKKIAGTTKVSGKLETGSEDKSLGGFIETSGASVNLEGAEINAGIGGTWLLDPTDIIVDAVLAAFIEGQLNAGTNVTLDTTSGGSDFGDITIASPITQTATAGPVTLMLIADRNVFIDQQITLLTGGALSVKAANTNPMGEIVINRPEANTFAITTGGSQTYDGVFRLTPVFDVFATESLITTDSTADITFKGELTIAPTFSGIQFYLNAGRDINFEKNVLLMGSGDFTGAYVNATAGNIITLGTLGDLNLFRMEGGEVFVNPPAPTLWSLDLNSPIWLNQNTEITGAVTHIWNTIDANGAFSLLITATVLELYGNIGSSSPLGSLTTSGPYEVNMFSPMTSVTTIGDQYYDAFLILSGSGPSPLFTFTSDTGTVTLNPSLSPPYEVIRPFPFFIVSVLIDGNAVINGNLGINQLHSLTVTGTTTLNGFSNGGATINVENQDYKGPVILGGNSGVSTLFQTFTMGGTIHFESTVNRAPGTTGSLSVGGGNIIFSGNVGSIDPLSSLTAGGGGVFLNGVTIISTLNQLYLAPVTINANSVLTSNAQNITFQNTVNGPGGLVVNVNNGTMYALENMGFSTELGYLTVNGTAQGVNIIAAGDINLGPFNVVTNDLVHSTAGNVNFTSGPVTLFANLDVIAAEQIFFGTGSNAVFGNSYALSAQSLNPIYGPTGQGVTGEVHVASLTLGGPGGAHLSQNYPVTESFVGGQGGQQARTNTIAPPNVDGVVIYCVNGFNCPLAPIPNDNPFFNIPPVEIFNISTAVTCDGSGCSNLEMMIDNLVEAGVVSCGGVGGCGFGFMQAQDTNGVVRILMPGDVVYAGDKILKDENSCGCVKSLYTNKKTCMGPKNLGQVYK